MESYKHKATATLIVQVTRKNEWKPKSPVDTFAVPEDSPIGTIVGVVEFTDADLPFDNIKCSIAGGNDGIPPTFYMEPNTGQLKLLNLLDAETTDHYSLTIQAVDLNNDIEPDPLKQKTSFTTVTVNILFTTAVLILTSTYWSPDHWFVALMVIAGLLALGVLYGLAWILFKTHPKCGQFFPKCQKPDKTHLTNVIESGQNQQSNSSPVSKEPKSETNSTLSPDNSAKCRERHIYSTVRLDIQDGQTRAQIYKN
ncbi:hypothetical protein scyTo_0002069 [Scyliorhinus torazame]|uniref:Cadherin domain-containing protein n=1 Tax=Scyliorhinus torazame TaxID=75743 RepID=A0A401PHK9_SCYTO|nr:hypothetical protein [Scyliorhinus torazame]